MKIALISTTIHTPRVLALYRTFGPEVEIIVAGDHKTPHEEVRALLKPLDVRYLDPKAQEKLGHASSEAIGWNCIQRRNIALLEALKSRPDVIVTVDDDNIPIDSKYFSDFADILSRPFNGLAARGAAGWFDAGGFLLPPAPHRGLPPEQRRGAPAPHMSAAVGAKVGVAAGLWLGDPDTDAMTRIVNAPLVHHVSDLMNAGLVVDPQCFAPFNTQNTAYAAEVAPLMPMWIGIGRYDDIWASLFAQRIMMTTGHHVHFGRPYVWQQRNEQDLQVNLENEAFGDRNTARFAEDLRQADVGGGSILERMQRLFDAVSALDYVPARMKTFAKAWCADIDRIGA